MNIHTQLLKNITDETDIPDAQTLKAKRIKDNTREVNVIPSHIVDWRGSHEFKDVPNLVLIDTPPSLFDAFITRALPVTLARKTTLIIQEQPLPILYALVNGTVIYSVQREV